MPGVAIVIPCWNSGALVEDAVASAVGQTVAPSEVVVVDDGSDQSATLHALARVEHQGVRVLRTPNQGVAKARQHGVAQTTSPWIVLLDADDRLAPTFLAATLARLEADPALDYVATAYELFGDASARFVPPPPDQPARHLTEGSFAITALVRRELWERLGGCDPALEVAEDWDFWLGVLERNTPGALIEQPLVHYRIRAGSRDGRGLDQRGHQRATRAIVAKHRAFILGFGPRLLEAKAAALSRMGHDTERLLQRRREVLTAIAHSPGGLGRLRRAPAVAVLCYHRVAALAQDHFGLCTPEPLFRAQLEHIAAHRRPIAVSRLAAALEAGDPPADAVAVTLDDGYLDAFTASRIAADLGVPITLFVNTDRLQEPHEAWQEILERVFLSGDPVPPAIQLQVDGAGLSLHTLGLPQRAAAFDALYHLGRAATARGRQAIVEQVSAWSGLNLAPRDSHRLLTGREVQELSRRPGHEIGSHSANHLWLPAHPGITQRGEVESAKTHLEQVVGRPVDAFAYPYGEATPETVEIARRAGYRSAFTTQHGVVRPWADPLQLPRIEVGTWTALELAQRLDALFAQPL